MALLEELQAAKESGTADVQVELLDHLVDVFQSGSCSDYPIQAILNQLVPWLVSSSDREIELQLADTLLASTQHPDFGTADLSRLALALPGIDDSATLRVLLAVFEERQDFEQLLRTYLDHEDPTVADAARSSLELQTANPK